MLDGELMLDAPHGKDMSAHSKTPPTPDSRGLISPTLTARPDIAYEKRQSLVAARPTTRLRQPETAKAHRG